MSEMVLRLPNSYVEVESDEMEYVDGGGTLTINVSRDFLRDCFTAGSTAFATAVGYAVAAAVVSASGYVLTPLGSTIAAAVGGAVGWIFGGVYSRSQITSDFHTSVYIPLIDDRTFNIA